MPAGAHLGTLATLGLRDAGNESTTFQIWGPVLTAANIVAQTALWETVYIQAMDLVLGAKEYTQFGNRINALWDQPTNGAAREIALKVAYRDATTGQRFTASLGTLDPTIPEYVINTNAKDIISMSSPGVIDDFVQAVNAFARNPYTGNACEVTGLRVARGGK